MHWENQEQDRSATLGSPKESGRQEDGVSFKWSTQQGSLAYTPEHCLVNGGVPLFFWKKQHVSNGCKMEIF